MIEAVIVLKVIVAVELRDPWIRRIGFANGRCVVPIWFRHMISVASAVDYSQMAASGIVNDDFRPSAESPNVADCGK